jgi:transaldolase
MKLFLDTADTDLIEKHFQTDLIDGITTNPTLIMKSGRDPEEVYQQLIDMGIDDISMEVVGDFDEMYMEGLRLSRKFGKNATIKVPCTPAGLKVCKKLSRDLVNVNVTLIFSAAQAILAAKAGAKYVSPFVGRVDDNSFDGIDLIDQISDIYTIQNIKKTEILAASVRDVKTVSDSFESGAHVVTMPPAVFEKMYNHVLTDKGLYLFDMDWAKVKR